MSMAKPCASLKRRHTKTKGCLVHKSKNPGRSPASNNLTLSDRSNVRQIGPQSARATEKPGSANRAVRPVNPSNPNQLQIGTTRTLLYFHRRAGVGELLLDGLRFFLVYAF